jgi:hypothetical protein
VRCTKKTRQDRSQEYKKEEKRKVWIKDELAWSHITNQNKSNREKSKQQNQPRQYLACRIGHGHDNRILAVNIYTE